MNGVAPNCQANCIDSDNVNDVAHRDDGWNWRRLCVGGGCRECMDDNDCNTIHKAAARCVEGTCHNATRMTTPVAEAVCRQIHNQTQWNFACVGCLADGDCPGGPASISNAECS